MNEIDAGLAGMATSAKSMLAKTEAMAAAVQAGEQLSHADALATIAVCHDALEAVLELAQTFQHRETITRLRDQNTATAITLALAANEGRPH